MNQLFKMAAAPAVAAFVLACAAMATPAAAGEYCRIEYGSGATQVCSFATMEQCQAAVSGRNGVCERDPFLPDNSNAFAYQPKHPRAKNVKHPVVNR